MIESIQNGIKTLAIESVHAGMSMSESLLVQNLRVKGQLLYTDGVLFYVEWCIRQL